MQQTYVFVVGIEHNIVFIIIIVISAGFGALAGADEKSDIFFGNWVCSLSVNDLMRLYHLSKLGVFAWALGRHDRGISVNVGHGWFISETCI